MRLDDSALDRAYAVFEEWGPTRRIPRKVRLAETFPALDDAGIDVLIDELKKVSQSV